MQAKYGIKDCDFYDFDETGFMMGMIGPAIIVTRAGRCGRGKAVQPSNSEWATATVCITGEILSFKEKSPCQLVLRERLTSRLGYKSDQRWMDQQ